MFQCFILFNIHNPFLCAVAAVSGHVDCVLNCDSKLSSFSFLTADMYMHLPIVVQRRLKYHFSKSSFFGGNYVYCCSFFTILHISLQTSKFDRFSITNNLPAAISFAKSKLTQGNKLLICCENGKPYGFLNPISVSHILQ